MLDIPRFLIVAIHFSPNTQECIAPALEVSKPRFHPRAFRESSNFILFSRGFILFGFFEYTSKPEKHFSRARKSFYRRFILLELFFFFFNLHAGAIILKTKERWNYKNPGCGKNFSNAPLEIRKFDFCSILFLDHAQFFKSTVRN